MNKQPTAAIATDAASKLKFWLSKEQPLSIDTITQLGEFIITFFLQSIEDTMKLLSSTTRTSSTGLLGPMSMKNEYPVILNFSIGIIFILITMWFILFPVATHAFRFPKALVMSSKSSFKKQPFSVDTVGNIDRNINTDITTPHQTNKTETTKSNCADINVMNSNNKTPSSLQNLLNEVSSIFEERSAQVKKALEEFSQPFVGFTRNDSDDDDYDEDHLEMTVVVEGMLNNDVDDDNDDNAVQIASHDDSSVIGKDNNAIDNNSIIDHEEEQITHFCFLVHGYRGKPADLLYLRSAMADTAEKSFASNKYTCSRTFSTDANKDDSNHRNSTSTFTSTDHHVQQHQSSKKKKRHRIVLHSCQSNWNCTSDGVQAGGERIFNEILTVIRTSMQNHSTDQNGSCDKIVDVTMSLIGNSLGGLYSRYAIAKLAEFAQVQQNTQEQDHNHNDSSDESDKSAKATRSTTFMIDGKIRIHFNIFCTTATPHLGVSGLTYFPLPRSAELGIGSLMGQTGHDLFRMSPLIKIMCTNDLYLKPLCAFRKRIAYANGYYTDFVVSTQTAAFLHPESTIPHDVDDENGNDDNGMVAATLYTQASGDLPSTSTGNGTASITSLVESNNDKTENNELEKTDNFRARIPNLLKTDSVQEELLEMSSALDQLGWKKVIVDLRNEMPMKLPVPKRPKNILPRIVKKWSKAESELTAQEEVETGRVKENELDVGNGNDGTSSSSSSSSLVEEINHSSVSSPNKILESRDVANAYSIPDDFIGFPLGHNTMVAVAQSRFTFVFKGGRPLMDKLAVEMIDEILTYEIRHC